MVKVKAALNFLAYAFVIAMAQVNGDTKHQLYRNSKELKKPADDLLKASGIHLSNGEIIEELRQFQDHLSDNQIIEFDGLNHDRVTFIGNSRSAKKLYLVYDRDNEALQCNNQPQVCYGYEVHT